MNINEIILGLLFLLGVRNFYKFLNRIDKLERQVGTGFFPNYPNNDDEHGLIDFVISSKYVKNDILRLEESIERLEDQLQRIEKEIDNLKEQK